MKSIIFALAAASCAAVQLKVQTELESSTQFSDPTMENQETLFTAIEPADLEHMTVTAQDADADQDGHLTKEEREGVYAELQSMIELMLRNGSLTRQTVIDSAKLIRDRLEASDGYYKMQ